MSSRRLLVAAGSIVAIATLVAAIGLGGSLADRAKATSSSQDEVAPGLFVGDFDVPAPGWQQFSALQREIDRPDGESFELVGSPVRQGTKAARFTARQGYSRFGHNEDTEVVLHGGEKRGDDYWYAWSTLFPQDWEAPHKWGIFAQWHARLGTSPIVSLNARADSATLNLLSGITDEEANRTEVNREIPILSSLAKGQWNDFLLHVRWSTEHDGLLELYHRVKGSATMRRVAYVRNVPTFQVTREGKGVGTYLLLGIYRGSMCPQPTELSCSAQPGQPPNVLFHDGFTRAPRFEQAARSAFPGQLPKLVLDAASEQKVTAAPMRLTTRASAGARVVERGASLVVGAKGVTATVSGPQDDRDTAVATYRLPQRETLVVRARLGITTTGRRLAGNVVVAQIRDNRGRRIAELYVDGNDRTISVYSPPKALQQADVNLSTNLVLHPGRARPVELRLSGSRLVVVAAGKVRLQVDVDGPKRGTRLSTRVGIDHYDGTARNRLRVTLDELEVGAAG
jgi:hypothetical protein